MNLKKNMCVCDWITLLYTWNQQNIINQLYFNKMKKKKLNIEFP